MIVGHDEIVHGVLTCLFVGGHCLLEGVPGLGKTLLVRTLAQALDLDFSRIQFTPDLMPADILGTNMVMEIARRASGSSSSSAGRSSRRSAWPTKSTAPRRRRSRRCWRRCRKARSRRPARATSSKRPFFVMATQNPIEQEGTYPLPEAQLDRFFFKLLVGYSEPRGTGDDRRPHHARRDDRAGQGDGRRGDPPVAAAGARGDPGPARAGLHRAAGAGHASRGPVRRCRSRTKYLRWGASPRAAQTLALAAKVRALLDGRYNVSFEDVRRVYLPALRHRVILNFEAQAEGDRARSGAAGDAGEGARKEDG